MVNVQQHPDRKNSTHAVTDTCASVLPEISTTSSRLNTSSQLNFANTNNSSPNSLGEYFHRIFPGRDTAEKFRNLLVNGLRSIAGGLTGNGLILLGRFVGVSCLAIAAYLGKNHESTPAPEKPTASTTIIEKLRVQKHNLEYEQHVANTEISFIDQSFSQLPLNHLNLINSESSYLSATHNYINDNSTGYQADTVYHVADEHNLQNSNLPPIIIEQETTAPIKIQYGHSFLSNDPILPRAGHAFTNPTSNPTQTKNSQSTPIASAGHAFGKN